MTTQAIETSHIVKFYENEIGLYSLVGDFLAEGRGAGSPLVVIARSRRHESFAGALRERGFDPERDIASGHLRLLDAEETLSKFMSGRMPDPRRFDESIGALVRTLSRVGSLRAYGEMVDVLWQNGNPEGAVRLEELWNDLLRRHAFQLFCAYPLGNFERESDCDLFDAICATHTHVLPAESQQAQPDEQSRLIAQLQQRALVLESEIRQRKELETALRESLAARKEAEEELRRLYEMAQAANRAKDQFLATLSHELRTPLTAILGWARMLNLGGMDPQLTRTALETIEQSARIQATIVDDLLDLSKIVTGKVALLRELVDLGSVVDEAVQTCRLAAEAKNITVDVTKSTSRVVVVGDPTRLRQIVWNLFSNAIKYSDDGARVTIAIDRSDSDATIRVSDNGRGISPEFLRHVFEPFRQADSSSTRGHGGLGLGLTIVKHLTELHGGSVEARSEGEGRGSTFTVTLPVVKSPAIDAAPPRDAIIDLHGKRILVVDDETATLDLLTAVLCRFGAKVEVADSVAAAIDRFLDTQLDAITTDIALSDADGFALLAEIRSRAQRRIPVVALTALSEPDSERRLQTAGFDACFRKPIDPIAFAHRLAELVGAVVN